LINSSPSAGSGSGHISCPNLFVAYINTHVVKINEEVNPGIAHDSCNPLRINISPVRCAIAIQTTAVTAAPNTDMKNVALLDLTKGPDQKAIPVSIEL
jgi:hypothetical protein